MVKKDLTRDRKALWEERQKRDALMSATSGVYCSSRIMQLLERLLAAWPRRGQRLLVINAGSGQLLDPLWQAGFDITVQEECPELMLQAKNNFGSRADYIFGVAESIPRDDCYFDYVLILCGLEYWANPDKVLAEINRVSRSGCIFLFVSTLSFLTLGALFRRNKEQDYQSISPLQVRTILHKAFPDTKQAWRSNLLLEDLALPLFMQRILPPHLPMPAGPLVGVRVDYGPLYSGTPLLLRAKVPFSASYDVKAPIVGSDMGRTNRK